MKLRAALDEENWEVVAEYIMMRWGIHGFSAEDARELCKPHLEYLRKNRKPSLRECCEENLEGWIRNRLGEEGHFQSTGNKTARDDEASEGRYARSKIWVTNLGIKPRNRAAGVITKMPPNGPGPQTDRERY
jgi:hypothetical protein